MSLPSPADSPSPSPSPSPFLDPSSRKRQRSQSMESAGSDSSTVKRTVPDNGTSSTAKGVEISNLSLADLAATSATAVDSPMADAAADPPYAAISGAEKWTIIETLQKLPMEANQTWYIVEHGWYERFKKACSGLEDKQGIITEAELGPVDNSPLVLQEFIPSCVILRPAVVEGIDVEFVPEEAWTNLQTWYGPSTYPIERKTIAKGYAQRIQIDLYPLFVRLLHLTDTADITLNAMPSIYVQLPSTATVKMMATALADHIRPPSSDRPEYRIWQLDPERNITNRREITPIEIYKGDKVFANPESTQTLEEIGVESTHVFAVEFQNEQKDWLELGANFVQPQPEQPLFGSQFFDNLLPRTTSNSKSVISFKTNSASGFGKQEKAVKAPAAEPGLVGLGNIGNTCFMNSALQCLAHQPELVNYFTHDVYKSELNPDNPLGMNGEIAEAFGALLNKLWDPENAPKSYTPRDFKMQLQRFAPQFQGYQQHDSQELVAFLLDGLHEDLNRVLKKPYVEKPEWNGKTDEDLIQLAEESWEGYMKRNDSVIVDLFQGQYQSTLTCPECQKVSITFDPFMYLTLPLPVNKKWKHTVLYVPWDVSKPHVKIPVEIGRDGSMKDLKQLIGRWMDAIPDNLMAVELWNHKFFKNFEDSSLLGEIQPNDHIALYELPCNARQSKNRKVELEDPMLISVYISEDSGMTKPKLISYPSIVVLYPDQVETEEQIYNAVIERIQRWTSNPAQLFTWAPSPLPVVEIDENGQVSTVQEGDVADEAMTLDNKVVSMGPKKEVFTFRVEHGRREDFGGVMSTYSAGPGKDSWKERLDAGGALVEEGDMLFCYFDENMRDYFFSDDRHKENYNSWPQFVHPEHEEGRKEQEKQEKKGLTLQDCLDEFTKEEKLGEEDLWYCPTCKKHQQATKKFDLWKTPDILVVHLKRFSNSRALRDKIDAHIDFPIQGLDLSNMVGAREEKSWVYDLFAVDEHLGGLGGGHYRAYAQHHEKQQWYHFDDSHVSPVSAEESVNSNAYLLFYRRRSDTPLGGTTFVKTEQAKGQQRPPRSLSPELGLPTPPSEPNDSFLNKSFSSYMQNDPIDSSWPADSIRSTNNSPSSSLGVELDDEKDLADSSLSSRMGSPSSGSPASSP